MAAIVKATAVASADRRSRDGAPPDQNGVSAALNLGVVVAAKTWSTLSPSSTRPWGRTSAKPSQPAEPRWRKISVNIRRRP